MGTSLRVFFKTTLIFLFLNVTNILADPSDDDIIVNTRLGKVKGSLMKSRQSKDIFSFRGLNFAEPPIGELRFKDPVAVRPWKGIRDASKEGPACIQPSGINLSEDCLTLNIYTKTVRNPLTDTSTEVVKKSPVIVYIHPGAYYSGSSQSFLVGPRYLLDHDVVLVTINHRLGFLGFINTGDEYSSGNYGFKDQVLALQFVQDNIEAFGGDPNSVTLTGESSGSRSIILHMVSPMSKGLFHRAIGMSGTAIIPIPPQKEQVGLVLKQARLLNCPTKSREKMFRCLRKLPAEAFTNSTEIHTEWYGAPFLIWHPAIEPENSEGDRFLIEDPKETFKSGKINCVPLILGFTEGEVSLRALNGIKDALNGNNKYFEELNDRWYDLAPINFGYERGTERSKFISREIYKYYFGNETKSLNNSKTLGELYSNSLVQYPTYKTANLITDYTSSPVYLYNFTYQGRYSKRSWTNETISLSGGVQHGDDLQYIFDSPNDIYNGIEFPLFNEGDPEIRIVKIWTTIWAHFSKIGEQLPKNNKLFKSVSWRKYDSKSLNYLNIGTELKMENNVFKEKMKFWDSLPFIY